MRGDSLSSDTSPTTTTKRHWWVGGWQRKAKGDERKPEGERSEEQQTPTTGIQHYREGEEGETGTSATET